MPLTDTAARQAKPTGKDYTLKDGGGLACQGQANFPQRGNSNFPTRLGLFVD
jgi:hypothetical protein